MRKTLLKTIVLMIVINGFQSCHNSDDSTINTDNVKKHFIIMNMVGTGNFLSAFGDLNPGSSINNANAFEHVGGSVFFVYKNTILVADSYQGDNITKYTRSPVTGDISLAGNLFTESGSKPTNIAFSSEQKAYVSLYGKGKIFVMNPTTMTKITEIDLSKYAITGHNPSPASLIIRDGLLYVCLRQVITDQKAHDGGYVAIIDTKTDEVKEVISDKRVTSVGEPNDNTLMFVDEKNDLYIYSQGMFGYQEGAHDGFIRIKSGETKFDPDYYFSVKASSIAGIPNNKSPYAYFLEYDKNGDIYGTVSVPGYLSNPPDYVKDRNFQPFRINIYTKQFTKLDLKPTTGWSAQVHKYKNMMVFGLSTTDAVGLFTYDLSSGNVSEGPVVTTEGNPFDFHSFIY